MIEQAANVKCGGYTVRRDGDEVVVSCRACGPTRLSLAAARHLVDPVFGLTGPLGRFHTSAGRAARAELADALRKVLVDGDGASA